MRGSLSLARRREDDDDLPFPDDPDDDGEPEPPAPASAPDLALQIRDIRGQGGCLPAEDAERVREELSRGLATQFPNADLRVICMQATGGRPTTTIAVWTRPVGSDRDDAARARGLQNVDFLAATDVIGIFVNAGFIRRTVQEAFQAIPKRYSGRGRPSADGPIHLTGYTLTFDAPDQVVLQIHGYDERPWPDVSFTITYTDTVSVLEAGVRCESAEPVTTDDRSWLNVLTSVLGGVLSFAFWPAFYFLFDDVLEVAVGGAGRPPQRQGVAAPIVASFFPDSVQVPDGKKLDLLYQRAPVSPGGMFALGAYIPVDRQPRVVIRGSDRLSAHFEGPGAQAEFRAIVSDMRAPLTVQWSGDGIATPVDGPVTTIMFPVSGRKRSVHTREVSVRVVDVDGLVAAASRTIEIVLADHNDEQESPLCKARPWLCE